MPNWCSNRFEVQGPKERIDIFEKYLNETNGKDWFDYFAACPEELKDTTASFTEEVNEELVKKYGASDWYTWNVNNYGCKWNCDAQDWQRPDEQTISFWFDSPWGPPIALYDKITESGLTVFASYHEEGMAFVGEYREGDDESYEYSDLESLEDIPEDLVEEWNLRDIIEYYDEEDEDE